jgi:hypothetical protein
LVLAALVHLLVLLEVVEQPLYFQQLPLLEVAVVEAQTTMVLLVVQAVEAV